MKFRAETIDKVGDKKEMDRDFVAGKELKPGKKFKYGFQLRIVPFDDASFVYEGNYDVSAWPVKVLFKDGTTWEDDGSKSCRESSHSVK